MTLFEEIKKYYPELDTEFKDETIILQNDSDGKGDYIIKWDYEKPLPPNMKVGKNDSKQ